MTTKLKVFTIALLSAAVTFTATAGTTNLLQPISFALTVYAQGATNTLGSKTTVTDIRSTINSKSLIKDIATGTTNVFSSKAFLAIATPVTLTDISSTTNATNVLVKGSSSVVIVDGKVITPVSDIILTELAGVRAETTVNGKDTAETSHILGTITVSTGPVSFTVQGILNTHLVYDVYGVRSGKTSSSVSSEDGAGVVSGSGTVGSSPVVISGSVGWNFLDVQK